MKFLSEIHRREYTARRIVAVRQKVSGLRSYQLSSILPRSALEDVFLGFSVCGQFLISYKIDFKRFLLRFWFFPPQSAPGSNETSLELFAEAQFFHITYMSRFQDTPCVRFIQSTLDYNSFLLLSCDSDGNGLVTAYGSMPNVDCETCMSAHLSLNGSPSTDGKTSRSCSVHLQVLLLNLDLPSMTDRIPCAYDQPTELSRAIRSNGLNPTGDYVDNTTCDYIPPCLQSYGPVQQQCGGSGWTGQHEERSMVSSGCTCFASTPWPIGGIQVSVCAKSGALRLAWVSPDAQIKVISCVFEPERRGPKTVPCARVYPQGTAYHPCGRVAPFAFQAPLLTQNYCSRCYSWPVQECMSCILSKNSTLAPGRLLSSECIFRQNPSCIYLVTDANHWPDNHKQPELPLLDSKHECVQSRPSFVSQLKSSNWLPDDMNLSKSLPAFLHHRPLFTSCLPLTYLAMLEDIRASYIHWTLISRIPWTSTSTATTTSTNLNADLMEYHRNADLNDEDTAFSVGSRSSQENDQDDDQLALVGSPISVDETQSPEDLLAHRLSGHCHTSFDLTAWQEVYANPMASLPSSPKSMVLDGRIIAHLEEVVFDIPLDQENMGWLPASQSLSSCAPQPHVEDDLPILSVFSPTEEPDLLLIYQIHHMARTTHSSRSNCTTIRLFGAIDLTTGERVSLNNGQSFSESGKPLQSSGSLLLTLNATRLKQLTAHCPQNPSLGSIRVRPNLVHELNNFHMTSRLESVKLIVDPQGGYAVYW